MVVRTECKGRKVTGIYIGARNARRNFREETAAIEFELGHLRIGCELSPVLGATSPGFAIRGCANGCNSRFTANDGT